MPVTPVLEEADSNRAGALLSCQAAMLKAYPRADIEQVQNVKKSFTFRLYTLATDRQLAGLITLTWLEARVLSFHEGVNR